MSAETWAFLAGLLWGAILTVVAMILGRLR